MVRVKLKDRSGGTGSRKLQLFLRFRGKDGVGILVFLPGNALTVAENVKAEMDRLTKSFRQE